LRGNAVANTTQAVLKNWILRRFVPRFDHHLAYHSNARDYALMHGARPEQITVIHNTINEARIQCMAKPAARAALREKHPGLGERRIVLFIGAVLKEKRIDLILDAMSLMARTDVVLMVVGDGPHLPALRAAAQSRTHFLGLMERMDPLQAKRGDHSSWWSGWDLYLVTAIIPNE
jgi:glycosyltransferase involved in cell wall biosynthesis